MAVKNPGARTTLLRNSATYIELDVEFENNLYHDSSSSAAITIFYTEIRLTFRQKCNLAKRSHRKRNTTVTGIRWSESVRG